MAQQSAPITVKNWKAGVADEAWKVMICARDANRAQDIAGYLTSLMTDLGVASFDECLDAISQFTGEQIAGALRDAVTVAAKSIERGLEGEPA